MTVEPEIHNPLPSARERFFEESRANAHHIWTRVAYNQPEECGAGPFQPYLANFLSSRYPSGTVLEAMCGYQSYFEPSRDREVTALDFCQAALDAYPYCTRRQVCFDLNAVSDPQTLLSIAPPESFDIISICFGYSYLQNPHLVFEGFRLLLKNGGKLVLAESPRRRYLHVSWRQFTVLECSAMLAGAGFAWSGMEEELIIPAAEIFLLEATRSRLVDV